MPTIIWASLTTSFRFPQWSLPIPSGMGSGNIISISILNGMAQPAAKLLAGAGSALVAS